MAASAAAQGLQELETRWRPQRLEMDAEVAGWLLGAEQSYASGLTGENWGEKDGCSSPFSSSACSFSSSSSSSPS